MDRNGEEYADDFVNHSFQQHQLFSSTGAGPIPATMTPQELHQPPDPLDDFSRQKYKPIDGWDFANYEPDYTIAAADWGPAGFNYAAHPPIPTNLDEYQPALVADLMTKTAELLTEEALSTDDQRGNSPSRSRGSSVASGCLGSACSSACEDGDDCDRADKCDMVECESTSHCGISAPCSGIGQPCDAPDCGDKPDCRDQCGPLYTCDETKAAATLASFVGDMRPPEIPRQSHLGVNNLLHSHSYDQFQTYGMPAKPSYVVQHIFEAHDPASGSTCVRPCLIDQPSLFNICPINLLAENNHHHGTHGTHSPHNAFSMEQCHMDHTGNMLFNFGGLPNENNNCHGYGYTDPEQLIAHVHGHHGMPFMHQHQAQTLNVPNSQLYHTHATNIPEAKNYLPSPTAHIHHQGMPLTLPSKIPGQKPLPSTPIMSAFQPLPTPSSMASDDSSANQMADASTDPIFAGETKFHEKNTCLWHISPNNPCCERFEDASKLNQHVIDVHLKALEKTSTGFHCEWEGCKRNKDHKSGFPQKSKIERHIQSHTGDKPFECAKCHKTFSAKQALDQHLLIHEDSKPLKCTFPGCNKTFRQQSARTMHMRTHTKDKPLVCQVCGRRFSESSNLSKHRRTHDKKGAYECDFQGCSKTFHRQDQLRRHQKTHERQAQLAVVKEETPMVEEWREESSDMWDEQVP